MPQDIIQNSFAGGVISEGAFARVDLQKFGSAVALADGYFIHAEGGISNKAGTTFIKEVKDSADITRMITFEFNDEQAYALEFGDLYMRVIQNGGIVLEADTVISGATQANPVVITDTGHPYANGDEAFISEIVGMVELNNKFYILGNVTANTYELVGIDGTGFTAYVSGGTAGRVFTLVTPYLSAELATLKFRQSNDVMFLAHKNHEPRQLTRTGAAAWTLEIIDFEPDQPYPTGIVVTVNTTGAVTYTYQVTAVNEETAEESLVGVGAATVTITGATQADPVVITGVNTYAGGEEVAINGIVGMTELNGRRFIVANPSGADFELKDEDGTGYTAYVSDGTANETSVTITNGAATADNTITFDEQVGAESYNIYKADNGLFGFIGATETLTFTDDNIAADLDDTAPKWRQPFQTSGNFPGAVGLHEQRSVWGNTDNEPLKTWMSQTSQFENMNVSSPTRASDSVVFRLVTGQGNQIRHYRSFQDRLFIFTSGVVWSMRPGGDVDAITPSSKKASVEEYASATDVPPLTIKKNILMVAGKANQGFEVQSLGFDLQSDAYTGSDLTVLARDLFKGFTINEWAYAERPYRLLACVRSDGSLLVMAYLQEHQVFAWSVWTTDGTYESVCSVPEGQDDAFYFVVKRTINGSDVRYIERYHERDFTTIVDAFFVDSGLTLDITNPVAITGATQANPVVISSVGHPYEDDDKIFITDIVGMTKANDELYTVANKTANTYELQGVDGTGFTAYVSGGEAQKKITALSGLDHLEGETDVLALADGNIEDGLTITNGATTLTNASSVIQIGLPYTPQINSLPLNLAPATMSRKKVVKSVTLRVKDTRGIFIGPDADNLEELPARSTELWGDPAAIKTDLIKIPISDDWDRDAGITIQAHPGLPQTILSMIADTDVE